MRISVPPVGCVCALLLGAAGDIRSGDIVINEIVAWNRFGDVDEDGDTSDWVEVVNTGDTPIDLS